jgi:hypothetical protein
LAIINGFFRVDRIDKNKPFANIQFTVLFLNDRLVFVRTGGQFANTAESFGNKHHDFPDQFRAKTVEEILQLHKNNFQILYSAINNVELKEDFKLGLRVGIFTITSIDKNIYNISPNQNFIECYNIVRTALPGKIDENNIPAQIKQKAFDANDNIKEHETTKKIAFDTSSISASQNSAIKDNDKTLSTADVLPNNVSKNRTGKSYFYILLSLSIVLIIILIIVVIRYADINNPIFWVASAIEVCLAYVAVTIRRNSPGKFAFITCFAVLIPILFQTFNFVKPILWSNGVFIAAAIALQMFLRYKNSLKNEPLSTNLPSDFSFNAVFPTDRPLGLSEQVRRISKNNQQTTLDMFFLNDNDSSRLWILESDGVIIPPKIPNKLQNSEIVINGFTVNFAQEIRRNTLVKKPLLRPYMEATWSQNGVYFNVHSARMSWEDLKQILVSMIK